jgi:hypothetical protein
MALTPEQHLHLAQLYEKLGVQLGVPAETKLEFDRKAKWHRILARSSSSLEQPPPRARIEVDGEALPPNGPEEAPIPRPGLLHMKRPRPMRSPVWSGPPRWGLGEKPRPPLIV